MIVGIVLWLIIPPKARAASSVPITANEPFALRFTLPSSAPSYTAKIRFYDPSTGDYFGQTLNDTTWLDQSDSWSEFPVYPASSTQFIIGRIDNPSPNFLVQIAIRKAGSSTTTVLQEFPILIQPTLGTLELAAYAADIPYTEGVFMITENSNDRFVPLLNDATVQTLRSSEELSVGFYSVSGSLIESPRPYSLVPGIQHTIALHAPAPTHYEGKIRGPSQSYPNQQATFELLLSPSHSGVVRWFLDGKLQAQTVSQSFTTTFATASRHTIEAYLPESKQTFKHDFLVQSIPNIRIYQALPNPSGSDARKEEIIIKNNNPFPIALSNWKLKSRTSNTSIPISGDFGPSESRSFVVSSKLLNKNGAYDLLTESNEITDTLFYDTAPEGAYLERIGLDWQTTTAAYKTPDSQDNRLTAEGTVTKPRGNIIDIRTANGPLHIVIHKSFDGTKPRLHSGDIIRLSGIMKESKKGPYLSVRAGDQFLLIEPAARSSKKTKKSSQPKPRVANAVSTTKSKSTAVKVSQIIMRPTASITQPFPTGPPVSHMWYLFAITISAGASLLLAPSFSSAYGILKKDETDSIY